MQNLLNNQNLINVIVAIVIVAILIYIVLPYTKKFMAGDVMAEPEAEKEKFNSEEITVEEAEVKPEAKTEAEKSAEGPYVDSQTGALIDGPGFEKGEIDDVYQESATGIPSNYYFLDDGAGGEMSIQHNLCSPSCCSEQYPLKKFLGEKSELLK